jgi:hypothetical protein
MGSALEVELRFGVVKLPNKRFVKIAICNCISPSADHCREALRACQTYILQIEHPGFQSRMHVSSLPALGIASQVLYGVSPISQIQCFPSDILRGSHPKGHAVDQGLVSPDPDLSHLELLENRPDWEVILADDGTSGQSNTGRNAVLMEETKPVFADKLSVGKKALNLMI